MPSAPPHLGGLAAGSSGITTARCAARRRRLREALGGKKALFHSGLPPYRGTPGTAYPFRQNSHTLYLFGPLPAGTLALLSDTEEQLFVNPPDAAAAVWEGPGESFASLKTRTGVAEVLTPDQLAARLRGEAQALALPDVNPEVTARLAELCARMPSLDGPDRELAEAIIEQRLIHDDEEIAEIRRAVEVTAEAHRHGMRRTRAGLFEFELKAAMEWCCRRRGFDLSFASTVSVHGEVLHNSSDRAVLSDGDLLLADLGAETPYGYAGDITRTWPVSGRFTALQRDVYQLVLQAGKEAIARCRPGIRFRDVHMHASLRIADGLVQLGVLRGEPSTLVERGAHALFFPHGIGHLLGLDVHDMEDLGDLAGYASGWTRPEQFGSCYLRLDRILAEGMTVTIEPGFYRIPALLEDPAVLAPFKDCVNPARIAQLQEVRGIRIEDDVLITAGEPQILSHGAPKEISEVEALVGTAVDAGR